MSGVNIIVKMLLDDASINAAGIADTSIYPGKLPLNFVLPAVAVGFVSGRENRPLAGRPRTLQRWERIRVTVAAASYTEAQTLHATVRKALRFATFQTLGIYSGVSVVPDIDGPEMELTEPVIHLRPKDYWVGFLEANP